MMFLNSNLELNKDDVELLQQFNPTQAASYENMQTIINMTNQIIDKNR